MDYLKFKQLYNDTLSHHGIKGQKWGVRRFQNEDGTLTPEGKARYEKEGGKPASDNTSANSSNYKMTIETSGDGAKWGIVTSMDRKINDMNANNFTKDEINKLTSDDWLDVNKSLPKEHEENCIILDGSTPKDINDNFKDYATCLFTSEQIRFDNKLTEYTDYTSATHFAMDNFLDSYKKSDKIRKKLYDEGYGIMEDMEEFTPYAYIRNIDGKYYAFSRLVLYNNKSNNGSSSILIRNLGEIPSDTYKDFVYFEDIRTENIRGKEYEYIPLGWVGDPTDYETSDERANLWHSGVKGMKWGVRKEYEPTGNRVPKQEQPTTDPNASKNQNKKRKILKVAATAAVFAGAITAGIIFINKRKGQKASFDSGSVARGASAISNFRNSGLLSNGMSKVKVERLPMFHSSITEDDINALIHHGIKGQRWGVRRFQNEDGTLTPEGKQRYYDSDNDSTTKKIDELSEQLDDIGKSWVKKHPELRIEYDDDPWALGYEAKKLGLDTKKYDELLSDLDYYFDKEEKHNKKAASKQKDKVTSELPVGKSKYEGENTLPDDIRKYIEDNEDSLFYEIQFNFDSIYNNAKSELNMSKLLGFENIQNYMQDHGYKGINVEPIVRFNKEDDGTSDVAELDKAGMYLFAEAYIKDKNNKTVAKYVKNLGRFHGNPRESLW